MVSEAAKRARAKYAKLRRKNLSVDIDKKYYEEVILPFISEHEISVNYLLRKALERIIEHPEELEGKEEMS